MEVQLARFVFASFAFAMSWLGLACLVSAESGKKSRHYRCLQHKGLGFRAVSGGLD